MTTRTWADGVKANTCGAAMLHLARTSAGMFSEAELYALASDQTNGTRTRILAARLYVAEHELGVARVEAQRLAEATAGRQMTRCEHAWTNWIGVGDLPDGTVVEERHCGLCRGYESRERQAGTQTLLERLGRHAHDLVNGGTGATELRDDMLQAAAALRNDADLTKIARGAWHMLQSLLAVRDGVPDQAIRVMAGALLDAIERAEGQHGGQ